MYDLMKIGLFIWDIINIWFLYPVYDIMSIDMCNLMPVDVLKNNDNCIPYV